MVEKQKSKLVESDKPYFFGLAGYLSATWMLVIVLFFDILDLAIGWIPVAGEGLDVVTGLIFVILFGPLGGIYFIELIFIGPLDIIPTGLILYIAMYGGSKLLKRKCKDSNYCSGVVRFGRSRGNNK